MKQTRRIYQKSATLEEAAELWHDFYKGLLPCKAELLPVIRSLGRVTAEAVQARISSPSFHSSAMDGYAVRFEKTFGASETTPIGLQLGEDALPVNTGDPLPEGYNAVIMVEDVSLKGEDLEITAAVTPYQHVRAVGEDIVQTELILPENHRIRPVDIAAMLAGGNCDIKVRERPSVTIIPTGNEIVEPGCNLETGNIIDFNSYMIGGMVEEWGGKFRRTDVVSDNKESLKESIVAAVKESDITLVIAGSSAGTKDFTPDAVGALGDIILHGISIRPGKPVLLAEVDGKAVIGLPGYPVSAWITFELFGKPLICHLLGIEPEQPDSLLANLSRPVASSLGQEEFIRVRVGRVGDNFVTTPVRRGAGSIMTVQRADGILQVPALSEGIEPGSEVEVRLLRSRREIADTIVCMGSHDNTLDILANSLKKHFPSYSLSSAHVGSMGGIMAIRKSEAHLAGTHLLDEETGEYNTPFIRRLLKDIPLKVLNLVYREQGLIVSKSNPKNIDGILDLTREDIFFINRQAGSGTRLLADKCLRDNGVDPHKIKGYEREEYTHMGVASAVASGVADAGMGILTAAIALDLHFVPVTMERYDLVIREEYFESPMMQALLQIISSDGEFRDSVASLGGYALRDMGKVVFEQS